MGVTYMRSKLVVLCKSFVAFSLGALSTLEKKHVVLQSNEAYRKRLHTAMQLLVGPKVLRSPKAFTATDLRTLIGPIRVGKVASRMGLKVILPQVRFVTSYAGEGSLIDGFLNTGSASEETEKQRTSPVCERLCSSNRDGFL
jgi:hypothetical protein